MRTEKTVEKTIDMNVIESINSNTKEYKLEGFVMTLKDKEKQFNDLKLHYYLYKEGGK